MKTAKEQNLKEKKRLRKELTDEFNKKIFKTKKELTSIISHELRTPLSVISWYAKMLLTGDAGKLNNKERVYLSEIYKGNERAMALANDLIDAFRLELGTMEISLKPTDVVKSAKEAINETRGQIRRRHLKFTERYDKRLPLLNIDPRLLQAIFQNLLSNAVKFTPKGGSVRLDLRFAKRDTKLDGQKMRKDGIAIIVKDTGCGIPRSQQKKIFTKIFRADNAREKNIEGTGLGLVIVKEALGYFGGKIWFKSKENKGTTFYAVLPLLKK
jgi:signal transduction histidine kinase